MPHHTASPEASAGPPGPQHVAIIMDGNGRWALARGLPRVEGHRRGLEALRNVVRAASELALTHLTLFSFSTENWRRPEPEIAFLFGLLKRFVRNDLVELHAANVRVRIIGDRVNLPGDIRDLLLQAEDLTAGNTGLCLVVAFNYGARDEITRAVRALARQVAEGHLAVEDLTEERVAEALDTGGIPDPDLVIRTSGEERVSNFLLWQLAYAEFVFLPVLWPDFGRNELQTACEIFRSRQRRYGGIEPLALQAAGKAAP